MTHKSASAVTLLAALLAGCATPQERVRTVRVEVPVPVACPRPTMPARPPLPLASLHALTGYAAQLEAINGH